LSQSGFLSALEKSFVWFFRKYVANYAHFWRKLRAPTKNHLPVVKKPTLFDLLLTHFRLDRLKADIRGYLRTSFEIAKLDLQAYLSHLGYIFVKSFIFSILFLLAAFFLTLSLALLIGQWLDNMALGFALMGFFYLLLVFLVWLARHSIRKGVSAGLKAHFAQTFLAPQDLEKVLGLEKENEKNSISYPNRSEENPGGNPSENHKENLS
jgi:hypothetical protein